MDSIIYLATKSQPATKIHSLSTDPTMLRDMLAKEYKLRRSQGAPEVLDCILECGDNHELIINKALADGFIKLNLDQIKMGRVGAIIPRGRELAPQMDMTEKLRQAEMAKVEARHQRETAQLEYEIVQLQRMKTEEQAKQREAIQRITVATGGRSPTIALTPEKMAPAAPATPPRAATSADSPAVDTDARAEAIARAAASRAARLGGGHHVSASTPKEPAAGYVTPPSTKALAPASTVKAPAPPLAAPDAKRPRVAIPVGSQGSKPAEGAARNSTVDNEKPGAKATEGGAAKGKGKAKEIEGCGKEAKLAGGAAGHSMARAAAKDTGSDVGKAKGKGKSKENDSRAEGAKADRGTLASAARDSTADRTAKAVALTEGKAEVQKNKGEAKPVGNMGEVKSNQGKGDVVAEQEKGEAELGVEAEESKGAEAEDDKGEAEAQEDNGEAEEAEAKEDEGEENQAEVQEGEVEGAEAEGDTHDEAEAVEAEGAEAEEDMGEAAEDEDMGQVKGEDEAKDDNMDKAEGDAEVEDANMGETEGEPAGLQGGDDVDG